MPILTLGCRRFVTRCCLAQAYVRRSCRPRICRSLRAECYPQLPLSRTVMDRGPFLEGRRSEVQYHRMFCYLHESSGRGGWRRRWSLSPSPRDIPWESFSWLKRIDRWGQMLSAARWWRMSPQSLVYVLCDVIDKVNQVMDSWASFDVFELRIIYFGGKCLPQFL